jgi:hypothetical protein
MRSNARFGKNKLKVLVLKCKPNVSLYPRMKIKPGSKMRNLIPHSIGAFTEFGLVLFSGYGPAVTKVASIAEIVKRRFKNIHQTTHILYRQVRGQSALNDKPMCPH